MIDECLRCKKHYTQGGTCNLSKNNCLMFDEEPRGKMIRTNVTFGIDIIAETPVVKRDSKINFDDVNGKVVEMTVIKINALDLNKRLCSVTVEYHEKETPFFERKKCFKLLN